MTPPSRTFATCLAWASTFAALWAVGLGKLPGWPFGLSVFAFSLLVALAFTGYKPR